MGDLEYQELCKQKVEEIDPNIRLCNYNLKGAKGSEAALRDLKAESKGPGLDLLQSKLDVTILTL